MDDSDSAMLSAAMRSGAVASRQREQRHVRGVSDHSDRRLRVCGKPASGLRLARDAVRPWRRNDRLKGGVIVSTSPSNGPDESARQQAGRSSGRPRISHKADVALRVAGLALVIAGVVLTGFAHSIAIALIAIGFLVLIINETLRRLPPRPIH